MVVAIFSGTICGTMQELDLPTEGENPALMNLDFPFHLQGYYLGCLPNLAW